MAKVTNGLPGEVQLVSKSFPRERFAARPAPASPKLLTHQFPVRPDLVVPLTLPAELTTADARRIAEFVTALAFPDAEGDS